jgi:hypothetical protein
VSDWVGRSGVEVKLLRQSSHEKEIKTTRAGRYIVVRSVPICTTFAVKMWSNFSSCGQFCGQTKIKQFKNEHI